MSDYIYGRHFTLVTDDPESAAILSPNKANLPMVAARLQRWASFLSGYDYTIEQHSTQKHANADFLSRFPLSSRTNCVSNWQILWRTVWSSSGYCQHGTAAHLYQEFLTTCLAAVRGVAPDHSSTEHLWKQVRSMLPTSSDMKVCMLCFYLHVFKKK